jgi:TatD DNase family protein
MNFVDAHCHLADLRIFSNVQTVITRAEKSGIRFFLQGGVDPDDWERQLQLQKQFPNVWPCFGLHPYYVADHSEEDCEQALEILTSLIAKAAALGETGLDFRAHIIKDSYDRQINLFEKQLELARIAEKPVVLHIVQAFEKSIQVLELFGIPKCGGIVHSFNGPGDHAHSYLKLGLHISVGGPAARTNNEKLHQAIAEIPMDRLLLETDSPDQPPPGIQAGENEPSSLWKVAESVGKIKGMSATEVLDKSSQNLRKLLSK